ncbi:MAG TPA: hypothetical protein VMB51_09150 [Solirubrobacteraceae bacterium]|nr:hypothetical protein [Solirubrobacteraceae bacterium]
MKLCAARVRVALGVLFAGLALVLVVGAAPALAGAWWQLSSRVAPTNLRPGGKGLLLVAADDIGDSPVEGGTSHVTVSDLLPEGLALTGGVGAVKAHRSFETAEEARNWSCTLNGAREVRCASLLTIPPYEGLELEIPVEAQEPAGIDTALANRVSVSGGVEPGGSAVVERTLTRPISIGEEPVGFGVEPDGFALVPENDRGESETQAGGHPFQLTADVGFDQTVERLPEEKGLRPSSPALARNLSFNLPPGLLGDVNASERCSEAAFSALGPNFTNLCPSGSVVGVATVSVNIRVPAFGYVTHSVPLFNLVPGHGEPARFGFEIFKVPVMLDTAVRTGGDYGVSVNVENAPETAQILASQVTFWGTPSDPAHNSARGWPCLIGGVYASGATCTPPGEPSDTALLTLPSSCTGPLNSLMTGESWSGGQLDSGYLPLQRNETEPLTGLRDCQAVPFDAAITTQPVEAGEAEQEPQPVHSTSTPSGLDVGVTVPQHATVDGGEPAGEADVQSASVTLPEGVLLNPSAANGLQACSEGQIGYQGPGASSGDPFAPGAPEPLRFSDEPPHCPAGSKLGTVHIKTPLLAEELEGSVYLASPAPEGEAGQNPFDSLLALYIVAESETLGLTVKLAGESTLNAATGQITTTFSSTPQVPFEQLRVQLFGGPRGPLSTPAFCGTYQTSASFTPWSGNPSLQTSSEPGEFDLDTGTEGEPCPSGQQPFTPSIQAGSTNLQAGAFTNFTFQLSRPGPDQPLTGLTLKLPPGDAALLKNVTPCSEPQAAQGACGPESEIGQATATAGLGPDPYTVGGGRVYITGPYDGAPFGLSIVTPAVAGPFDLGNVVVRSKIEVDPHTAQVTISSPLPTIVQAVGHAATGIPLDLRQVNVTIDRPNFEYNPTDCTASSIAATLTGAQGATASTSTRFQVAGCQGLPFRPAVTATTKGRTSKADGASLGLTFKSRVGEAHVARTVLTIPAMLPARLTTIQKACVAATFEVNPAACGEGSDIGTAVVHTPVLKNPLSGPIYLVSHGNAAWPDAELVLQGEGVTVILDGQTAIKKGVTTSSFLSVPDAPFESVEATLPEGPHSALTTNLPLKDHYSLCGQHLTIPTALTGQNGSATKASVKVSVQGCAAVRGVKARRLSRRQKLARALKACRKASRRSHARPAACERRAERIWVMSVSRLRRAA